jgi:Tfp pilus assembly protein PilP
LAAACEAAARLVRQTLKVGVVGKRPGEEGPKGPTPEEIERLRIATELNQFRYVGFMAVGGGAQKKKSMAVVVHNDEMHVVQAGEVIGGEVLVKDVSQKEITLQDVASKITQIIPVTNDPGAGEQPN